MRKFVAMLALAVFVVALTASLVNARCRGGRSRGRSAPVQCFQPVYAAPSYGCYGGAPSYQAPSYAPSGYGASYSYSPPNYSPPNYSGSVYPPLPPGARIVPPNEVPDDPDKTKKKPKGETEEIQPPEKNKKPPKNKNDEMEEIQPPTKDLEGVAMPREMVQISYPTPKDR